MTLFPKTAVAATAATADNRDEARDIAARLLRRRNCLATRAPSAAASFSAQVKSAWLGAAPGCFAERTR